MATGLALEAFLKPPVAGARLPARDSVVCAVVAAYAEEKAQIRNRRFAMQVTPSIRQKFLEDGYIIVRGIIPDEQLPALRQQYEVLVEQMVHKSEEWESSPQPRLNLSGRPLSGLIDEQTIGCVEAWLPGSEVHRVSSALLGVESASVYEMMMLCSPKREQLHYPAWHRDFEPRSTAPIGSFAADTLEGGPRHLSWNIPLYDSSIGQ